jgi:hypothetical protein
LRKLLGISFCATLAAFLLPVLITLASAGGGGEAPGEAFSIENHSGRAGASGAGDK